MLTVSALKFGYPVTEFVLMKPNDLPRASFHSEAFMIFNTTPAITALP